MENKKVEVISKVNGMVSINLPELRLNKQWPKKNSKVMVELDKLEEAIYYPGVERMFTQGVLYIEDLEVKKHLGLEPEDATAPVNMITLSEDKMRKLLTVSPVAELKQILSTMPLTAKREFAEFAINNELGDFKRSEIIEEACGINILKGIELKRANEEE